MICPICNATVKDGSNMCPACGADLSVPASSSVSEFIFCEGCGARLNPQDRTCPKCGRPAPGILSQNSAASDLAAGKTASFPRVTSEMIAEAVPAPTGAGIPDVLAQPFDSEATSVMSLDDIAGAQAASGASAPRAAVRKALPLDEVEAVEGDDPYGRPRRGRWIALVAMLVLVAGGAWFVATDPMGVMPGFYESFDRAASDMFPSRQVPQDEDVEAADAQESDEGDEDGQEQVSDSTVSEAEAFQRLSAIYAQIIAFQDEIGPVVDTYNGQYLAKDLATRQTAAQGAYDLRDSIQAILDELDGLELAEDTAYSEDVDHLKQLATWTYNRVDVLCRSWDINLALPDGERPADHQDEILAPLRGVEKVNGKAVDVVQFEENVNAWKPVEK